MLSPAASPANTYSLLLTRTPPRAAAYQLAAAHMLTRRFTGPVSRTASNTSAGTSIVPGSEHSLSPNLSFATSKKRLAARIATAPSIGVYLPPPLRADIILAYLQCLDLRRGELFDIDARHFDRARPCADEGAVCSELE